MAFNYNPAASLLFAAVLLLFAASSPSAHVSAATLNGLTVSGRLCCTANGNCPGQGIAGVGIRLNCSLLGVSSTVGVGTTDATGAYTITVPALPGMVLGLPVVSCVVSVPLPLNAALCPVLSTATGLLVGTLRVVGTAVSAVLGLVQSAVLDVYIHTGV